MYRVGVIGCRGIGVRHGNGVQGIENAELVAGCDLVEDQLKDFDERFGATNPNLVLYTDFQEMLEKADLDVLTVATGDNRHTEPVIAAAEAGVKGVFCEKPLAVSVDAAVRMVNAVEKNNVMLSVDHTRRWMPLWCRCHELVTDGAIGDVHTVIVTYMGPRAILFRNGTHLLDAMNWFSGSKPKWLSAELEGGYEGYSEYRGDGGHDPDNEPCANAYIHFSNGVRGFYIAHKKAQNLICLDVFGTDGQVHIENTGSAHMVRNGEVETVETPIWDVEGIEAGVQELVRAVDGKNDLSSTIYDGQIVVDMMLGILQSQQEGNAKVVLPKR